MTDQLSSRARAVTESDMAKALNGAGVSLPITSAAELLDAFNCILDLLGVPHLDSDGFVPERGGLDP